MSHFTRELLRDKHETIGRLDGRLTGPSSLNVGETSEFDPSNTLIAPPFRRPSPTTCATELGYKTDLYYYVSGGIQPWDCGVQNGFGDTTSLLRNAFSKNPYLKVMVAAGYFDLATPYFAIEHTFNHMGLNPEMHKNVIWNYYQAGHMLYIDSGFRREAEARYRRVHFGRDPQGSAAVDSPFAIYLYRFRRHIYTDHIWRTRICRKAARR